MFYLSMVLHLGQSVSECLRTDALTVNGTQTFFLFHSHFSFTFLFLLFFPRNAFVNCIKVHNNNTLIHHLALLTDIKEHLKFNMCKKLCCLFQSAPSIARMCDKKCQRQNRPGKTNHLPEITFG